MGLEVISDAGKSVDWWFMYKLPEKIRPLKSASNDHEETDGNEYLYFDADSGPDGQLALSEIELGALKGCMAETVAQVYEAEPNDSLGWILYNDEIPDAKRNRGTKGHTKGVIAFDIESDTAFWLLHSWPEFPDRRDREPGSWQYGQTYLCIQLDSVKTAREIAHIMFHLHEPQTYQSHVPKHLPKDDPLRRLIEEDHDREPDPAADYKFESKAGEDFRLFAKSRTWSEDFWIDLVGHKLDVTIDVETWRRFTKTTFLPPTKDADKDHEIVDVLWMNIEHLGVPYEWHYTKDHSKWGVSETDHWVCVADLNRMTSQEKRGGGAICFRNEALWKCLREVEQLKK